MVENEFLDAIDELDNNSLESIEDIDDEKELDCDVNEIIDNVPINEIPFEDEISDIDETEDTGEDTSTNQTSVLTYTRNMGEIKDNDYEDSAHFEREIVQEKGVDSSFENAQQQVELDYLSAIDNINDREQLEQLRDLLLMERIQRNESQLYEEKYEEEPKTLTRSRKLDFENLNQYNVDENTLDQVEPKENEYMSSEFDSFENDDVNINEIFEEDMEETIEPPEIDYDEILEELDSYDYNGVDYLEDSERLDNSLKEFQLENWENLDLDSQKQAINELAEYIEDISDIKNPPIFEYYNNPEEGDYGSYDADTNTLNINEYMLHDSSETTDTIAHELWHAYQHQRALNPQNAKDWQYRYNFEHYISPQKDSLGRYVNFTEYQDQLVEDEARAFAEQFKERLAIYNGSD